MPVTTNTRKLAALLGASGAGIGTDGLLQAAAVDANIATQAELDAIPVFDDDAIQTNITQLAFYRAADHALVKYNLTDQVIDTYQDATGIDAGNSTNEFHDGIGNKVYSSQTGATSAGLQFRYLKIWIRVGTFTGSGYDGNAGVSTVTFKNETTGLPTNGYPYTAISGTLTGLGTPSNNYGLIGTSQFSSLTANASNLGYAIYDFGQIYQGVTKLYIGKHRTNGDVITISLEYSTDNSSYSFVPMPSSGTQYNASRGGTTLTWANNATDGYVNSHGFSGVGNIGHSSIQGTTNWTYTTATFYEDLTLRSTSLATASSTPTKGDLVVQIEDVAGTTTVGGGSPDIRGFVSRDGGDTFIEGTFVDEGTWGTNKRILAFHNLAFTGASGTDMRYKITTHNQAVGKRVAIHAASLSWA